MFSICRFPAPWWLEVDGTLVVACQAASCGDNRSKCWTFPCGFKSPEKKKKHVFKKKTKIPFSTRRKMCSSCGCILEQKQNMSNIRGSKIVLVNLSHKSLAFREKIRPSSSRKPRVAGQLDSRWAASLIVINGGDMRSPTKCPPPPKKKGGSVGVISTLRSWSYWKKVHKKLDFWGNSTSVKKLWKCRLSRKRVKGETPPSAWESQIKPLGWTWAEMNLTPIVWAIPKFQLFCYFESIFV